MSVALATILALLAVSPGAAYLSAYARGLYRHRPRRLKLQELVPLLLGFSLVPHMIALALYSPVVRVGCRAKQLVGALQGLLGVDAGETACSLRIPLSGHDIVTLFAGPGSSEAYGAALERLGGSLPEVATYVGLTLAVAVPLGWLTRGIVRQWALDLRIPAISPQSAHFYMLSGNSKELQIAGLGDSHPRTLQPVAPDIVVVTVAVEMGSGTYLYWGALADYELDDDGGIRRLVLLDSRRRPIAEDRAAEDTRGISERFYSIDGDALSIEFSHVRSLNVKYAYLQAERPRYENRGDDAGALSLRKVEDAASARALIAEIIARGEGEASLDASFDEIAQVAGFIAPPESLVPQCERHLIERPGGVVQTVIDLRIHNGSQQDLCEFLVVVRIQEAEYVPEEPVVLLKRLVPADRDLRVSLDLGVGSPVFVHDCWLYMVLPAPA